MLGLFTSALAAGSLNLGVLVRSLLERGLSFHPADLLASIGNTPLVELRRVVPEGSARVLVKLESANPSGSAKDRMALSMVEAAERAGRLRPGVRLVEASGGSSGTSLAMISAVKDG